MIAGSLDGHDGPGITYSPITYVHATICPGAQLELPWNPEYNALTYVLAGKGTVGPNKNAINLGQAAVFGEGD